MTQNPFAFPTLMLIWTIVFGGVDSVHAKVESREIKSFDEVVAVKDSFIYKRRSQGERISAKNVLLVFDNDNTLLTMNQDLGSDAWWTWQSKLIRRQTKDKAHPWQLASNIGELLAIQGYLFETFDMKPVEPNVPKHISALIQDGHPTMVLTSRGPDFGSATLRELSKHGLDFSQAAPKVWRKWGTPNTEFQPYKDLATLSKIFPDFSAEDLKQMRVREDPRNIGYTDGVMMVAGQHKGIFLRLLLKASLKPCQMQGFSEKALLRYQKCEQPVLHGIIFVDDKRTNTDSVCQAFEKLAQPDVFCLRYGKKDPDVRDFAENKRRKKAAHKAWQKLKPSFESATVKRENANF